MAKLSCGIVGLPNVGKSTLFNALTRKMVQAANFPFCTIEPNTGTVPVPDERLEVLSKMSHSKKIVPADITFVDIAGLVKGAAEGEGLGNQFLANIRETDAIIHVVRCFEDEDVIHVAGKVNPLYDIEVIELELALADLQSVEQTLSKMEKQVKSKKELLPTYEALKKARASLAEGISLSAATLSDEEKELLLPYRFLTAKKVIYAANVGEKDLPSLENQYVEQVRSYAKKCGHKVIPICARLEEELTSLPPEEAKEFLESLGLKETGLDRLIRASYDLLGLITFITSGEIETRAWTVEKGSTAPVAAGKIHSDIQKGFIRAEVVSYEDMIRYEGRVGARAAGKARSEGKEYVVKDGDVILFFHN